MTKQYFQFIPEQRYQIEALINAGYGQTSMSNIIGVQSQPSAEN